MKRRLSLFILIWMLILPSCGNQEPVQLTPSSNTRVVVDAVGREVEIPETIHRIGCLYAFAGHVTVLLGEEKKIVAVVDGLKRDKLLTTLFPSILDKDVPYTDGSINIEELAEIDPDVVFIRESTSENPDEMNKLKSFGIPAVVVDCNTIEEQRRSVQVVAEVCGGQAEKKAELYDDIYQIAIDTAKEKASQIDPEDRVTVYHSINEATRTDAKGTLPAEWTDLVGVKNVSVDNALKVYEGKMYTGLEQIYLWDPQLIICNEPGVKDYIMNDPKWAELSAVKNSRVYQMPIAISRWGHPGSMETPLAIYWLGKLAYPELYSDVDMALQTKNFYNTFFGYQLSERQVESILSGEGMRLENKGKKAEGQ